MLLWLLGNSFRLVSPAVQHRSKNDIFFTILQLTVCVVKLLQPMLQEHWQIGKMLVDSIPWKFLSAFSK